ncbi:MAG: AMP-binding protein [Evtepia gabavorous]
MEAFYTQFIQETFDETGQITHWAYTYADNYNYSYDVIDPLGERCSNRLAMLWRNDRGEEKRLTFGALKTLSIQAANLFQSRGLKKGDVIMTALRTHWSYWVVALAAHRLGLVLSPPTTCSPKRTSPFGCKGKRPLCHHLPGEPGGGQSPGRCGGSRRPPALCLGRRRWL